jgi:alpha-beta hydrolase superfamily lysophospholipase
LPPPPDDPPMAGFRHGADFAVDGDRIDGHLYLPPRGDDPPVVVLAHGFAGEKAWRLPAFARAFASEGLAAMTFDYRGFGDSEGEPRHLVDPARHVEDWLAAVETARADDRVGDDLALWGTSFSGGHALATAARTDVDAVVAQVPFLDGRATVANLVRAGGWPYLKGALWHGARDWLRGLARRSPHYVPVAGEPDEFAALNRPGTLDGYRSMVPDDGAFPNRCAARILLKTGFYRPLAAAGDVDCPTLLVEAERDRIVPGSAVDAAVERLDDVERVRYDCGHFDPYVGEWFERVVEREATFLARHLPV